MDKYITDIVQVYLSIFYFLIMLSNDRWDFIVIIPSF